MAKQPRGDARVRALRQVSGAAQRLIERGIRGLPAFNLLRGQFRNYPINWLSAGYQLGKSLAGATNLLRSGPPGSVPFLKDIPIVRGLDTGDPIDNRLLYRFTARIRPKYSRTPRTFTVDVASDRSLSLGEAEELARRQLRSLYSSYPDRRGGKVVDAYVEIDLELTYVARAF